MDPLVIVGKKNSSLQAEGPGLTSSTRATDHVP